MDYPTSNERMKSRNNYWRKNHYNSKTCGRYYGVIFASTEKETYELLSRIDIIVKKPGLELNKCPMLISSTEQN